MPISKKQAQILSSHIHNLVQAEIDLSGTGCGDPADAPFLKVEAARARRNLNRYIQSLTTIPTQEIHS